MNRLNKKLIPKHSWGNVISGLSNLSQAVGLGLSAAGHDKLGTGLQMIGEHADTFFSDIINPTAQALGNIKFPDIPDEKQYLLNQQPQQQTLVTSTPPPIPPKNPVAVVSPNGQLNTTVYSQIQIPDLFSNTYNPTLLDINQMNSGITTAGGGFVNDNGTAINLFQTGGVLPSAVSTIQAKGVKGFKDKFFSFMGGIGQFNPKADAVNGVGSVVSNFLPEARRSSAENTISAVGTAVSNIIPGPVGTGLALGVQAFNLAGQAFGKNANSAFIDQTMFESMGNSYDGTLSTLKKAYNDQGQRYSLWNGKGLREANANISRAQTEQDRVASVLDEATNSKDIAAGTTQPYAEAVGFRSNGGFNQRMPLVKDGAKLFTKDKIKKARKVLKKEVITKADVEKFKIGGKLNVIPEGALHAHKHNLDVENITSKGIPVVSEENGGVVQHAEIERNEIIFTLEVTKELEKLYHEGTDEAAIKAGEILVEEILDNTQDNTGLIDSIQ